VTADFLDKNPGSWFQSDNGATRPHPGVCFASQFLDLGTRAVLDVLPESFHPRIENRWDFWLAWIVDICADHADNRQALFTGTNGGKLATTFIDFGHMFGGAAGLDSPLPSSSRYLDWRIYPWTNVDGLGALIDVVKNLDADRLWLKVANLPDDWKTISALRAFNRALHRLSSDHLMRDAVECISGDLNSRRVQRENRKDDALRFPHSILPPGIRAIA